MQEQHGNMKSYDAADMRRYVEGGMSADEMHAFEMAMHDDPFLADAVEGMRELYIAKGAAAFDSDVQELRSRLRGKHVWQGSLWWKVAAAAVVVVIVGVLFLFDKKETVVLSEARNQPDRPVIPSQENDQRDRPVIPSEARDQPDRPVIPSQENDQPDRPVIPSEARDQPDRPVIPSEARDQPDRPVIPSEARDQPDRPVIPSQENDQRDRPVIPSEARDQPDRPVIPSEARDQRKQAASTDTAVADALQGAAAGVIIKRKSDKAAQAPAAANRQLESDTLNVVMHPTNAELNEVVVVGYSTRTKSTEDATVRTFSKRFEPAGGWDSFQRYVDSSKTLPSRDESNIEIVSFIPSATGRPTQFRILQSISREHDSETVRILENGPDWKILKGKKRRLTLKFQY